jgi:hypothetical protein
MYDSDAYTCLACNGGINRVRKRVYLEAAAHRRQLNRDMPIEPTGSESF